MVTIVFEDSFRHRPLRIFRRWHQLDMKNSTVVYLDCENEEDSGWYEVREQHFGIGHRVLTRVTQFFTLDPVSSPF